jgi:hypothetical protein
VDFVGNRTIAKFARQPARGVGLERIAGDHFAVGVTALQALERAMFEALGTWRNGRCDHSHLALRAAGPTDRQKLWIWFSCTSHSDTRNQISDERI